MTLPNLQSLTTYDANVPAADNTIPTNAGWSGFGAHQASVLDLGSIASYNSLGFSAYSDGPYAGFQLVQYNDAARLIPVAIDSYATTDTFRLSGRIPLVGAYADLRSSKFASSQLMIATNISTRVITVPQFFPSPQGTFSTGTNAIHAIGSVAGGGASTAFSSSFAVNGGFYTGRIEVAGSGGQAYIGFQSVLIDNRPGSTSDVIQETFPWGPIAGNTANWYEALPVPRGVYRLVAIVLGVSSLSILVEGIFNEGTT